MPITEYQMSRKYYPPLPQSHWDRLPTEIQCHVINLATWQCIRDRRNNEPLKTLLKEIRRYGIVKRRWGYGHVETHSWKCFESECYRTHYFGHYVTQYNMKRRLYLGCNFIDIIHEIEHQKVLLTSNRVSGYVRIKTD